MMLVSVDRDDGSQLEVCVRAATIRIHSDTTAEDTTTMVIGRYGRFIRALLRCTTESQLQQIVAIPPPQRRRRRTSCNGGAPPPPQLPLIFFTDLLGCFEATSATADDDVHTSEMRCICGVSLLRPYYIRNKDTEKVFMVGSECVKYWCGEIQRALLKSQKEQQEQSCCCRYCGRRTVLHNCVSCPGRQLLRTVWDEWCRVIGHQHRRCSNTLCRAKLDFATAATYRFCYACFVALGKKCRTCDAPIADKYLQCFRCVKTSPITAAAAAAKKRKLDLDLVDIQHIG